MVSVGMVHLCDGNEHILVLSANNSAMHRCRPTALAEARYHATRGYIIKSSYHNEVIIIANIYKVTGEV